MIAGLSRRSIRRASSATSVSPPMRARFAVSRRSIRRASSATNQTRLLKRRQVALSRRSIRRASSATGTVGLRRLPIQSSRRSIRRASSATNQSRSAASRGSTSLDARSVELPLRHQRTLASDEHTAPLSTLDPSSFLCDKPTLTRRRPRRIPLDARSVELPLRRVPAGGARSRARSLDARSVELPLRPVPQIFNHCASVAADSRAACKRPFFAAPMRLARAQSLPFFPLRAAAIASARAPA